ncbi:T9SS type A sorting domain-containing protein [Flaviaesturariibacter aridisoli]|uniref:T9SS type A sorting domain-containing protein n=1 Tax=Flaviaesturariibacter aridisoli TaxID=2545761 RepID=A0A4R4DST4_9BACT|nr:T9SS type A sorting domain-containing protein [Flaviaesturariibacter aridisoli]TCZ65854.1 T9SS type A sorting domain-containing protein [Flaviaesturariibacter aridisoli]
MRKTIFLGLSGLALTLGAGAQCPTPLTFQVPSSFSICNGAQTQPLLFGSNDASATFAWSNSNPSIGLAPSGSDDIAPFAAVNSGSTEVTATITVTATAGPCVSAPQSFTISVRPSPATPSLSVQGNLLQSSGGGTSYAWYYNGAPVDGVTGPSFGATLSGNYAVQVVGGNGCASAVSPALNLLITGVSALRAGSGLQLAANPVRGQALLLQTGPARNYTVWVLTSGGALLQSQRLRGGGAIDLSRYPAGVYLLLVRDERSGALWQERVVKA